MVKYRLQLRSVQNVGFAKTALIDMPCGQRYHYVVLQLAYTAGAANTIANAAPKLAQIRVKSNARAQRTIGNSGLVENSIALSGGVVLRDMNLLNGTQYDCSGAPNTGDGVSFPIFFGEPWRESPADQDVLGWSTAGWLSFQIEVDLANILPTGAADTATTPALKAWAVVDDFVPPANTNPSICKWIQYSTVPGGTLYDFVQLDRRDWLQQLSIYPDTGGANAPTQVNFKKNSVLYHEYTSTANTALLQQHNMFPAANGRTAGIYDLVFDHDGLLQSSLPMDGARDSLLEVLAGGSMSGTQMIVAQRLGPPE